MIEKQGYVFIADFSPIFPMFGKKINPHHGAHYENILTNELTPFENEDKAKRSIREYMKTMRPKNIQLAKLELQIAATLEEAEKFRKQEGIIVIGKTIEEEHRKIHHYYDLMGPLVEGKPNAHPLPGAHLYSNGYTPFLQKRDSPHTFDNATHLARELKRQGERDGITLAKFKLEYLN